MDDRTTSDPARDDRAADATATRAALYPHAAAGRAAELAARFDAWLALSGGAAAAGELRLPMLSGSMHPALPRGCTLVIAPLGRDGAEAPRPGDVAVFARDGRLVAHRVLRRAQRDGRPCLLEMGDANRRGEWRPQAEAVGVVTGAEAADGSPLPPPASRARARRLLLRHWAGVVLGIIPAEQDRDDNEPEGRGSP